MKNNKLDIHSSGHLTTSGDVGIRVKAGMSNHLLQASNLYASLCEQIEQKESN
jgi:hypothetical protein